jgi:predicted DNA-binding transcriptional regulator YafY
MTRARRLVTLLLLLQTGRGWTAAELADRLETSARTIHRDIADLREAGVPVSGARGPRGGFRLPGGYRGRVPLTEEEVAALLVGAPGAAGALGLEGMVLEARLKLIGSLSTGSRERIGWTAEVIHVDEPPWFRSSDEPRLLQELALAAADRRRIEVDYRAGRGGSMSRVLDPLGLVLKAGVWYLIGRSEEEESRIYRVSRVAALTTLDEEFKPPPGFELAAFWASARDQFERSRPSVGVTVRLARSSLPALRRAVDRTVRPSVRVGPSTGEAVELVLPFERLEYAFADLIKLAGAVEVLAPAELRERMAAAAGSLAATYGS